MRTWKVFCLVGLGLLVAAPAAAQSGFGFGVGVGVVKPEDVDSTFYLNAHLRYHLTDALALEPEFGYWTKTQGLEGLIEASVSDTSVGGNLIFVLPSSPLGFFVGAGLGAHILKGELNILGITGSDSETKLGVHLLGGLEYALSETLGVFTTARYDIVSDINQFKIYGGVRFYL